MSEYIIRLIGFITAFLFLILVLFFLTHLPEYEYHYVDQDEKEGIADNCYNNLTCEKDDVYFPVKSFKKVRKVVKD